MRLGILGTGQLAWMLGRAGLQQKREVALWNPEGKDLPYSEDFQVVTNLSELLRCSDRIIFENEFLDISQLRTLKSDSTFFPSLESIEGLQDKLNQKRLFDRLNIPTAPYWVWDSNDVSDETWLQKLQAELGEMELVFKWSRMGYDGKGNFFASASSRQPQLLKFMQEGLRRGAQIYAEKKLSFDHELALVLCRLGKQETSLPLVISEQHKGVCSEVRGPATEFGVPLSVEESARLHLSKIMNEVRFEGCMAAEFFYHEKEGLQMNEVAPRVHNSAHFSLDASTWSQFDLQVRAAFGESLPEATEVKGPLYFGMKNLLSPFEAGEVRGGAEIRQLPLRGARIYWYGKKALKSLRKLGHVNFSADSLTEFEMVKDQVKNWENEFWQKVRSENLK